MRNLGKTILIILIIALIISGCSQNTVNSENPISPPANERSTISVYKQAKIETPSAILPGKSTITPIDLIDGETHLLTPTPHPTSEHFELSRLAPVPFGETGSSGIIDFTIAELIRPATEIVLSSSSANPKPKDGMEYVIIDLIEVCTGPLHQECFIKVHNMRLIGSSGIERRPMNLIGIPLILPNRHINGGSTAYGYVAFSVDQNEENLVFYYEPESDGTVYLATE